MLFVDTLVPWTSEWLYHYELWVATRTWYGDGDVPVDLSRSRSSRRLARRDNRRSAKSAGHDTHLTRQRARADTMTNYEHGAA